MSDHPNRDKYPGQCCWHCDKRVLTKSFSDGPVWCGLPCKREYEKNTYQSAKEAIMTLITRNDDNTLNLNTEEHSFTFNADLTVIWFKGDEIVKKEDATDNDILSLIEDVVNGKLKEWMEEVEDCTAFRAFASTKDGNADVTLVEISYKRKAMVGPKRLHAVIYDNETDHGNNPALVSLMISINTVMKADDKKEDIVSDETKSSEKKGFFTRAYEGITSFLKKMLEKVNLMAKAWMGWNWEQKEAIVGALATCYGGMWFAYLMGFAIPVWITFPITGWVTYTAWAASFVFSYAVLAYLGYAAIYAVVMACAWLVNQAKSASAEIKGLDNVTLDAMAQA